MAWNGGWTGEGNRSIEPVGLGGGLQTGLAEVGWAGVGGDGDTTLGVHLEVHVWAPLANLASRVKVAGGKETQVDTMIQRCPTGW